MTQKKAKQADVSDDAVNDETTLILDYLRKQTVYHALQEASDEASKEAAAAIDEKIQQLQNQLVSLKTSEKEARIELAALSAKPLLSDLRHSVDQLVQETQIILGRLEKIERKDSVDVSPEEKAELAKEWKRWNQIATVRKGIFRDLWNPADPIEQESLGLEGSPTN
ncbi:putative TBP interacting domain protein [Aspergillus clavatus NRRL 1]|uniref:TBP interacting domain protein n=1 Tax=Aspergillus clavatus (strain ATCC 1007 / CBS 513.65 / DSM 816 / NCTC 3887 / NRRL 1 / QM 1276 / 107) TaxID=344612 RepID=A1CJ32_ASPCL|nr:uncharacterized protein ACLA_033590 [Aspergillus clavatus NRRL 1]EAW09156.1 conserved hypothetical protein [Aspergillus clavatus NRRL 1]